MNIVPVEKSKPVKSAHNGVEGMTQYQDRPHQFNRKANTPVISNLERSLSITAALLTRVDLPNREVIAKAHYYAQLAMAEAKRRMNHVSSQK